METKIDILGREYIFYRSAKANYTNKFNRMVKLATMFTKLSKKFDGMIERGQYVTPQARLAMACKMMMYTGIRIGNEDSAEGYMTKPHPNSKEKPMFVQTYGLTTLLPEHIVIDKTSATLNFLGKKHVENTFVIKGALFRQLCQLVKTVGEGETVFEITFRELTQFIKKYVGGNFTPKDFRTMRANMYAYEKLAEIQYRELPATKKEFNLEVKELATYVSEHLNNTPGVCKTSYIDKNIWDAHSEQRPITRNKK